MKSLLFVLLLSFCSVFSKNYYVSPNGDDNNNGSNQFPFRTIQKSANIVESGDTVFVLNGFYEEAITLTKSGSETKPIVFYGEPNKTIIDGQKVSQKYSGLFHIEGLNWIEIHNFYLTNSSDQGFYVENSTNITIKNNKTVNTYSSGIGFWGCSSILIDSNEVEFACNGGPQECISIANCDNFVVRHNKVSKGVNGNLGGEGIDAKDGSHNGIIHNNTVSYLSRLGIYVDAWDKYTSNIQVYNNIIYNCTDGIVLASEMGGTLENIWIFNNLSYKNKYLGINVSDNGDDPNIKIKPIKQIYIINNTTCFNGEAWGGGIAIRNPDAENIFVRNNLCSFNKSFQINYEGRTSNGLFFENNLIYPFMDYPNETKGENFVEADPLFVNNTINDYRINQNSPAIDKGSSNLAPRFDLLGNPRPMGKSYDIGAYEYVIESSIFDRINITDFLNIFPNPASEYIEISGLGVNPLIDGVPEIRIYNVLGECVISVEPQHSVSLQRIDVSGLPPGIYFVRIGEWIGRFVKGTE